MTIELVQPDGLPAMVRISWPESPSMINPLTFRDTAAAVVKLFSEAHVTLAQLRARRHL